MTITPDQARELLYGATPGPWHAICEKDDSGEPIPAGIVSECAYIDYQGYPIGNIHVFDRGAERPGDNVLAAAAPDMAETIAGMNEEWGVDTNGDALFPVRDEGHPMGSYFTPDRAEAEGVRDRMAKLNPHNNYLLVRRMVSVAEVIEGE